MKSYNEKLNAIYEAQYNGTAEFEDAYLNLKGKGLTIYIDEEHEHWFYLKCIHSEWRIQGKGISALQYPIDEHHHTRLLNKINELFMEVK